MAIEQLAEFILNNGTWILFLLVAVENLGIPGYPGGFTLPAMGVISRMGLLNPVEGFIIAVLSSSITIALVYLVGLRCGDWATARLAKGEKFDKGNRYLRDLIAKHGCPAVLIARLIPFVRVFVSITAGLLGMEWRKYYLYSFVGNLIYTTGAMGLGYFATAIFI